ncbi:MAG: 2-oxo acid dehydrogenase subunit E2 [Sphingosinicella sp.]|nr:2-oxo acid dehydrogenase subunit E2 [Sphingosinicella sp.]
MAYEFRLPQVGMGMQDGTVTAWLKSEGDAVVEGEPICEVESAKATIEIEAPVSGILSKILVEKDGFAEVQDVLALIEQEGAVPPEAAKPAAEDISAPAPTQIVRRAEAGAARQVEPRAKRLAEQLGLDLETVIGSGPGGRVTEADVEKAAQRGDVSAGSENAGATFEDVPHSAMRRAIAARVTEAKKTIPHFYLTVHPEVDAVIALRGRMGSGVTLTDFIIKAVAKALIAVPDVNVAWTEAAVRRFKHANIAVAIATTGGLVTPVVREVEAKSLEDISGDLRSLSERARASQLKPADYEGGQFTVSNLGMYGTSEFTAIINPPQAAILAVGAAEPRPVARNGNVEIATLMTCTLAVDHRAIDGAIAAAFLASFKSAIEQPEGLLQ